MNQRGVSESTQWAVLTPLVLMLLLGLIQTAVWLHARTVAQQAAATVADLHAARVADPIVAGIRVATSGGLQQVNISITDSGGLLVTTVTGRAPIFFDVGQGAVEARAVLPREEAS